MNDEAAFLAALAASPGDETLPLIFADWLEERDDPRGRWYRDESVRYWLGGTFADPIPLILESLAKGKKVTAARAAAEVIGEPIVPGLVELLKNPAPLVREQACSCLRKIGPRAKAAAPALMELLTDPNYSFRGRVAKALKEIGADATADTSKLKAALTDSNWSVRSAASRVLGRMGAKKNVLEELVERFENPDEKDRIEVIEGLKQLGTANVVTHLGTAADDPSPAVRIAAVHALGALKHSTVAPVLCDALADPEASVREAAAGQFAGSWRSALFNADSVTALTARLSDEVAGVRARASEAIGRANSLGEPAVPALLERLEDEEAAVRAAAARALGAVAVDDPALVAPLLERVADPEPEVAGRAMEALSKWTTLPASVVPGALAYIRKARIAGRWEMSVASGIFALGKVPSPPKEVLDLLRASIRDPQGPEHWSALTAIMSLGPAAEPALPELLALVQEEHARSGTVAALVSVGGPAFDRLAEILDGPDERARTRVLQRMWDVGAAGAPLLPALLRLYRRTAHPWQRSTVLRAIGRFGPAAAPAVPDLLDLLDNWDTTDGPGEVFNAMAFLGAALVPHLSRLAELAREPHLVGSRSSFAFLFANIAEHTPDALDPLRAVLRDSYAQKGGAEHWSRRDARTGALQGLMRLALFKQIPDPADLLADLAPLVTDPETPVREKLVPLLGYLGTSAAPLLCRLLTDTDAGIRAKAADALATSNDTSEATLAALVHAVEDREPNVRRTAIDTLNKLKTGTPEVLSALAAATADGDKKVAERAAIALKRLAPKAPKAAAPKAKGKKKPT